MGLVGSRIGRIRVLEPLGRGGVGEVYAGFDEKLKRKVAIKSLRAEYRLNSESKSRFLREAQILSQLQHPNICQIHDYIEGEDLDFLVLELVEGENLSSAIRSGLSESQRMPIAEQIASAVVSAHEQGIVHRDLKPGNIMLTPEGGVKVLDFGLARSLGDEVERTVELSPGSRDLEDTIVQLDRTGVLKTERGAVMGTLAYMSPEQARGEPATAASDIYSFGLLLQELFSGERAYDPDATPIEQLGRAALAKSPPVSGLDSDLMALIERQKALQSGARPSAREVVDRLRWIQEKPARRVRKVAIAAAFVLLLLLTGFVSYQALRISREVTRANREAETAKQVTGFLVDLFKRSDPGRAKGDSILVRDVLDDGAERLREELLDQPLVRARLMDTIGTVYRVLGHYDEADPLLVEALESREELFPADDVGLAESLHSLAALHHDRGSYPEAVTFYRRAIELREKALGADHIDLAASLTALGVTLDAQGEYEEAASLKRQSVEIRENALGLDHLDVATSLNNLAITYWRLGDYAAAGPAYERSIEIRRKSLGPGHPDLASSLHNLGLLYSDEGRFEDSERLLEESLAVFEKALGPDHPTVATNLTSLGALFDQQEQYERAEPFFRRALEIQEKTLGPDHPDLAMSLNNVANMARVRERYQEAEALFRRALEISRQALGSDHPSVGMALANLANVYQDQGQYRQAEPLYLESIEIRERAFGPSHPDLTTTLYNLANLQVAQGKNEEASRLFERSIEIFEQTPGDPRVAYPLAGLADLRHENQIYEEAELLYRRALEILEQVLPADHPDVVRVGDNLAELSKASDREEEAARL